MIKAVRETGKTGSVTVTIKAGLMQGTEDTVKLTGSISSKVPELDRPVTIMWSTADGDLIRNDPHQQSFDLRQVETDQDSTLRTIGAES